MAMTSRKTWAVGGPHVQSGEGRKGEFAQDQFPNSFESVFLENWTRIYNMLVRLVGDPDEAEDLALETFMRLYQHPPVQGEQLNLVGWLCRVATNLGLNAIRGSKRRQRYEQEAGQGAILQEPSSTPAELFAIEEERRRVRHILSDMNPRQAQLLVLRHSGMAYREIAESLGLAAASIGPLLLRAENDFERRYRALEWEKDL